MKSVEEYAEKYRETVQAAVPGEQVLSVGVLSRPGSIGGALLMQVSPAAAMFKNRSGKSKAAGLPLNVVVAATPTKVLFFKFKPKYTSIKVKEVVRELPRAGMGVTLQPGKLATRVTFHLGDGSIFELDSNRSVGQYNKLNDGLFATLGATTAQ